jgi:glutamine synthetase
VQVLDEVAAQFGLAALFQEKPFQGANGSGKHNNWSLSTDNGRASCTGVEAVFAAELVGARLPAVRTTRATARPPPPFILHA